LNKIDNVNDFNKTKNDKEGVIDGLNKELEDNRNEY